LTALRNLVGPVAVIGPIGESYSAPGQLAAEGLLKGLSRPPFSSRLGDYWLEIQGGLAIGKMDEGTFALLDMADGSGGKVPLATQRLEHLEMWMLLGDPALRLPIVPVDISLQAPEAIAVGERFTIEGALPARLKNAAVRLTLERPLNSTPLTLEPLPPPLPENREARTRAIAGNYERVSSFMLTSAEVASLGNKFTGSLEVPKQLPWTNLILRATATADEETGLGILALKVKAREK
jgi:hypothetical protein